MAGAEEVDVSGRASFGPEPMPQQERTFEYELVALPRPAESVKKSLDSI